MARHLLHLARVARAIRRKSAGRTTGKTEADREVGEWRTRYGTDDAAIVAFSSGQQSLAVAEEYIWGLRQCTRRGPRPFATASLLRPLYESSARAFWLLESGVGVDERTRRYMSDAKDRNRKALDFALHQGVRGDAIAQGRALDTRIDRYFSATGATYAPSTEREMLSHTMRAAAYSLRSQATGSDAQAFDDQAKKVVWYLNKSVHGDNLSITAMVKWRNRPRGMETMEYSAGFYEEALLVALIAYLSAARAAATVLGWNQQKWDRGAEMIWRKVSEARREVR